MSGRTNAFMMAARKVCLALRVLSKADVKLSLALLASTTANDICFYMKGYGHSSVKVVARSLRDWTHLLDTVNFAIFGLRSS